MSGTFYSGTWRGGFNQSDKQEVKTVFSIKQNAFSLNGVLFAETIYSSNNKENYSNQYKFFGYIKNNLVVINYEAMSNKCTGRGTLMLKSSEGGTILSGNIIHSEDVNNMWSINCFELKRD